jgi:hypothetical protein
MIELEDKPIKEIYVDTIVKMIKDQGERKTILDVANDRYLCSALGIDYLDPEVYTNIRELVNKYSVLYRD